MPRRVQRQSSVEDGATAPTRTSRRLRSSQDQDASPLRELQPQKRKRLGSKVPGDGSTLYTLTRNKKQKNAPTPATQQVDTVGPVDLPSPVGVLTSEIINKYQSAFAFAVDDTVRDSLILELEVITNGNPTLAARMLIDQRSEIMMQTAKALDQQRRAEEQFKRAQEARKKLEVAEAQMVELHNRLKGQVGSTDPRTSPAPTSPVRNSPLAQSALAEDGDHTDKISSQPTMNNGLGTEFVEKHPTVAVLASIDAKNNPYAGPADEDDYSGFRRPRNAFERYVQTAVREDAEEMKRVEAITAAVNDPDVPFPDLPTGPPRPSAAERFVKESKEYAADLEAQRSSKVEAQDASAITTPIAVDHQHHTATALSPISEVTEPETPAPRKWGIGTVFGPVSRLFGKTPRTEPTRRVIAPMRTTPRVPSTASRAPRTPTRRYEFFDPRDDDNFEPATASSPYGITRESFTPQSGPQTPTVYTGRKAKSVHQRNQEAKKEAAHREKMAAKAAEAKQQAEFAVSEARFQAEMAIIYDESIPVHKKKEAMAALQVQTKVGEKRMICVSHLKFIPNPATGYGMNDLYFTNIDADGEAWISEEDHKRAMATAYGRDRHHAKRARKNDYTATAAISSAPIASAADIRAQNSYTALGYTNGYTPTDSAMDISTDMDIPTAMDISTAVVNPTAMDISTAMDTSTAMEISTAMDNPTAMDTSTAMDISAAVVNPTAMDISAPVFIPTAMDISTVDEAPANAMTANAYTATTTTESHPRWLQDAMDFNYVSSHKETPTNNPDDDPHRARPYRGTMFAEPAKEPAQDIRDREAQETQGQEGKNASMVQGSSPDHRAYFGRTFRVPEYSDSEDSEVASDTQASPSPVQNQAGFRPDQGPQAATAEAGKRTNVFMQHNEPASAVQEQNKGQNEPGFAQQPPPTPTPAHAALPSTPATSATASTTLTNNADAIAKARLQAEKYKPKTPSGLRAASRMSSSPVPPDTNDANKRTFMDRIAHTTMSVSDRDSESMDVNIDRNSESMDANSDRSADRMDINSEHNSDTVMGDRPSAITGAALPVSAPPAQLSGSTKSAVASTTPKLARPLSATRKTPVAKPVSSMGNCLADYIKMATSPNSFPSRYNDNGLHPGPRPDSATGNTMPAKPVSTTGNTMPAKTVSTTGNTMPAKPVSTTGNTLADYIKLATSSALRRDEGDNTLLHMQQDTSRSVMTPLTSTILPVYNKPPPIYTYAATASGKATIPPLRKHQPLHNNPPSIVANAAAASGNAPQLRTGQPFQGNIDPTLDQYTIVPTAAPVSAPTAASSFAPTGAPAFVPTAAPIFSATAAPIFSPNASPAFSTQTPSTPAALSPLNFGADASGIVSPFSFSRSSSSAQRLRPISGTKKRAAAAAKRAAAVQAEEEVVPPYYFVEDVRFQSDNDGTTQWANDEADAVPMFRLPEGDFTLRGGDFTLPDGDSRMAGDVPTLPDVEFTLPVDDSTSPQVNFTAPEDETLPDAQNDAPMCLYVRTALEYALSMRNWQDRYTEFFREETLPYFEAVHAAGWRAGQPLPNVGIPPPTELDFSE